MKNTLEDIYNQVLLNEAEKHALQNLSQDEVGNLKAKADLFGSKPKVVEGPDKAKVKQGPAYEETTGSASKPTATKSSMPNSKPAKDEEAEEPKEVEGEAAEPEKEEDEKEEKVKKESFTMSAFETLFKKTLNEEMEEEMTPAPEMEAGNEELNLEDSEEMDLEEEGEEEEGDLISDLKDLQDKLASILSKLEDSAEESETEEESEDYTEEDFDSELGEEESEEEAPMKESMDKPKALNNSKGKALMSKKNKVGKLHPKGGKANTGKVPECATPKALGDKKAHLQKGKPEVKSTVKKGDFIK